MSSNSAVARPSDQALVAPLPEPVPVSALPGDDPSRDEWCAKFVQHMVDVNVFDHFEDGELILDYATYTATTYYENGWQRGMGPEECAEADMSEWGGQ